MNSIILLIIETIICLVIMTLSYIKYKKEGLYLYTIIALILSNIMSLKIVTIFDFDINLGIIPLITIFTSSNIIIQKDGPEEIKKLILTIITTFILSYAIIFLITYMSPSEINLFTNASYDNAIGESLRLTFANLVTILYSLLINFKLYYYLKRMQNNILISNLFSTIIIQFIASIIFGLISYVFTKELIDIIKIIMIRYLVSIFVGLIATIPLYITKYIKQ